MILRANSMAHALVAAVAALFTASPTLAHVGLEKPEAPRGKSYKAVLKIPHGCEGTATHTVTVEIPEGFIGVKPMPKAGWTVKTVRGPYAKSYGYYHGPLSEGVKEITWSGGELPDDYYDEFVASGFIAREIADTALYFKVVQVCAKGELRWVEVPGEGVDPHELKAPAAVLKIADDAPAKAASDAVQGASATAGSLVIEDAWLRATPLGAKVAAGYFTIRNTGSAADTLVAVDTPIAGRGEIHDMTMTNGVMRMRRMAEGLEIAGGESATLAPGGKHLMLIDLKEPLVAGTRVQVKLTFKSSTQTTIELPVRKFGESAGGHGDHGDNSHPH